MSLQTRLASLITAIGADIKALQLGQPLFDGGSMPGSPYEGQEVYYVVDDALGIYWHFVYDSAIGGLYKWRFVGGAPLFAEVPAAETRANGAYGDLTTVGPQVTVPLAGVFLIEAGNDSNQTATGNALLRSAIKLDTAAAADTEAVTSLGTAGHTPAALQSNQGGRAMKRTLATANQVLKMQYKASAGTGQWDARWLKVTPFHVA